MVALVDVRCNLDGQMNKTHPNTNSNVIGEKSICKQVKLDFSEVFIKCLCPESMGYIVYIVVN
jgi:hypothetical protein